MSSRKIKLLGGKDFFFFFLLARSLVFCKIREEEEADDVRKYLLLLMGVFKCPLDEVIPPRSLRHLFPGRTLWKLRSSVILFDAYKMTSQNSKFMCNEVSTFTIVEF